MPPRPYALLDVFSARPLEGNGLAVVLEADGLADATMHAFARETRLSETSFVQSPEAPGADYRHRIWTMGGEIPFAGHPSLGAAVAVAHARGEDAATYVQQTQPGLQPIDVERDGRRARASMLQEPATFGPELDPADILAMVGLPPGAAHPDLPCQVVGTGVPQVLAPVAGAAELAAARPDYGRIGPLLAEHGAVVLYLAAVDPDTGATRARSFGSAEMGEDPATGSAVGPLCALVAAWGGARALAIVQGVEVGRPSRLEATLESDRVRVSGDVVLVASGTVHLDD